VTPAAAHFRTGAQLRCVRRAVLLQMLKLSKTLDNPKLKSLAENMRRKLKEFRAHVPIITCICNPGAHACPWGGPSLPHLLWLPLPPVMCLHSTGAVHSCCLHDGPWTLSGYVRAPRCGTSL
jgi:hypothetical protein